MKITMRIISMLLCLCLVFSLIASAASYQNTAIGSLQLSDTAQMTSSVLYSSGNSSVRENIITYGTDSSVIPVVAYGKTLLGRSTMQQTAQYLTDRGMRIVAGVNGSFFDFNTGIPYGLVVTDGILRTSGNVASVGFFSNGSAVVGKPELSVKLQYANGQTADINYNKVLSTENGVCLYSSDYNGVTKNPVPAMHVILRPLSSSPWLTMNGSLQLAVTEICSASDSITIPEGGFVLSLAKNSKYASAISAFQTLQVGQTVTVTTESAPNWSSVLYACGAGDMLVENGTVNTSYTLSAAAEPAARTAFGIKNDGSYLLYTADEENGSRGLTLKELAERMKELGCQTAVNLDGGGSTMISAQYPGYPSPATVNTPSDGSARPCANFIYLVRGNPGYSSGAGKLFVYPYNAILLPGSSMQLTVKATDSAYQAVDAPQMVNYQAVGGTVTDNGIFTAQSAGTATVSAYASGMSGQTQIRVVSQPTSLFLHKENSTKSLEGGVLAGGSSVKLSADARYYGMKITAQNNCFTWTVGGNIGTVSPDGTFTAVQTAQPVSGTITASCNGTSATVNVTVSPSDPFADMQGHWAKDFVNSMYFAGVLTGSAGSDGKLRYRPNDSMTRQEYVIALMRFMGVDCDQYSYVTLPFADESKIASWALNAFKAAYQTGIVGGSLKNGKTYANPTAPISRQEAMVILARAQNLTDGSTAVLAQFPDRGQVASWAEGALSAMVSRGVITGSNGYLKPNGNVKRAEVAKMLYAIAQ